MSHLLLSNDYAEHIRVNQALPDLAHPRIDHPNDYSFVNNLFPAYYGHGLYAVAGALGVLTGDGYGLVWAICLISLAAALISYQAVYQASHCRPLAVLLSLSITFSIYNMQNAYARGAMPEFFATQALLASAGCLLLLRTSRHKYLCLMGAAFFAVIMAASHPITMPYDGILIIIIGLSVVKHYFSRLSWKKDLGVGLACLGLAVISVAHLAYIYYSIPEQLLVEKRQLSFKNYSQLFDKLSVRLSPLPLDPRDPIIAEATDRNAFLNTQIASGLLLLVLALPVAVKLGKPDPEEAPRRKQWLGYFFF